jgi:tetratricopeptide (TPR) repeat protein
MSEINDLRDKLLNDPDKYERLKAARKLAGMASEGNDEAAEILYEMLEKEDDPDVWVEPFKLPLQSVSDRRLRFTFKKGYWGELSIVPILKKMIKPTSLEEKKPIELTKEENEYFIDLLKKAKEAKKKGDLQEAIKLLSQYKEEYQTLIKKKEKEKGKTEKVIIEFAKRAIEIYEADNGRVVRGAIQILSHLADEDDLFNFLDIWLKKDTTYIYGLLSELKYHPRILQKIILAMKENPDEYSLKFVEIFNWLLEHPLPDTAEMIGKELWLNLPSKYKEAVRLYYCKEMEDFYKHIVHDFVHGRGYFPMPTKHPLLEWLESFERGAVTSSIASYSALQMVAEKIGLHLKDAVRQIETDEPSPITLRWQKEELQRRVNIELIPIDKYLGEYFPNEQLIKLYMTEIRDCAKRLNVSIEALRRVVEFHESAHAIVHLGRDAEGKNFNTGAFKMVDSGADPSPLHETLAQLLTYHCVKDHLELLECFERLDKHQPNAYQNWRNFTDVPLERIRNILIGVRQGRIEASFDMFTRIVM